MANNSRRKLKRGNAGKTISLLAGTSVFAIAVLGGGAWFAFQKIGEETLDTAFCYTRDDQYIASLWVDFSHTSEKYVSSSQDRDLLNIVRRQYEELPVNGKFFVFNTSSELASSVPTPAFTICRPAKTLAEQESIGAPSKLFTVLEKESQKARALFEENLQALMQDARDNEKRAKSSPIISQFRGITDYNYGAPLNRFIAFTDSMENSATNGKFCAEEGALKSFKEYAERSDYPNLRLKEIPDAEVDFFMVQFGALPNNIYPYCEGYQGLYDFYTGLFKDAGAEDVRFTPLGFGAG